MWSREMFVFIISTIGQNGKERSACYFYPEKPRAFSANELRERELKNPLLVSARDSAKSSSQISVRAGSESQSQCKLEFYFFHLS